MTPPSGVAATGASPEDRALSAPPFILWGSTVGKKAVMAVTGLVLFGYLVGHLLGNLQIYKGRPAINAYAAFLHGSRGILWGTRAVLLLAVTLHVAAGVQLWWLRRLARPVRYALRRDVQATWSSRTMIVTGLGIGAFVVLHLLDLTFGTLLRTFRAPDVYGNVVATFGRLPLVAAYAAGLLAVGMHLRHGLFALTQSLGAGYEGARSALERAALAIGIALAAGFLSIPIAVQAGLLD